VLNRKIDDIRNNLPIQEFTEADMAQTI